MADVPHFAIPFQFAGAQAAVVEQDSVDEIAYCAYTVLTCPLGFRVDLPEFGLPDPTFTQPVDTELIRETVEEWEPRALVAFSAEELDELAEAVTAPVEQFADPDDPLLARIRVMLQVATKE